MAAMIFDTDTDSFDYVDSPANGAADRSSSLPVRMRPTPTDGVLAGHRLPHGGRNSMSIGMAHGKPTGWIGMNSDLMNLKLSVYFNAGLLTVHVVKANTVTKSNPGSFSAKIKVELVPDDTGRTACSTDLFTVMADDDVIIDDKFSYELLNEDLVKQISVSAWKVDQRTSDSEHIGSIWFAVRDVCKQQGVLRGWFRLRAQAGPVALCNPLPSCSAAPQMLAAEASGGLRLQPQMPRSVSISPVCTGSCGIMDTRLLLIYRGRSGFGFSISGQDPVTVCRVEPGSLAELAGLRIHDRIVRIDGQNVYRESSEYIATIVRQADQKIVVEVQRRRPDQSCTCRIQPPAVAEPASSDPPSMQQQQQLTRSDSEPAFHLPRPAMSVVYPPAAPQRRCPLPVAYPTQLTTMTKLWDDSDDDGDQSPSASSRPVRRRPAAGGKSGTAARPWSSTAATAVTTTDYGWIDEQAPDDRDDRVDEDPNDDDESDKENRPTWPTSRMRAAAAAAAFLRRRPLSVEDPPLKSPMTMDVQDDDDDGFVDVRPFGRPPPPQQQLSRANPTQCRQPYRWRVLGTIDEVPTETSSLSTTANSSTSNHPCSRRRPRSPVSDQTDVDETAQSASGQPAAARMDDWVADDDSVEVEQSPSATADQDTSTTGRQQRSCTAWRLPANGKRRLNVLGLYRHIKQRRSGMGLSKGEARTGPGLDISVQAVSGNESIVSACSSSVSTPPSKRQRTSLKNFIRSSFRKLRR